MNISLGFDNKGKRRRKFKTIYAENKEDALRQLKEYVEIYKDQKTINRYKNDKIKTLKKDINEFCKKGCLKECTFRDKKNRWETCKAYKFLAYKMMDFELD